MSPASQPGLFVSADPSSAELASAIAWLWRLGDPLPGPDPDAVGIGGIDQARELAALVESNRLAGAVVLAAGAGEGLGWVPERRSVAGVARFPEVGAIEGRFTLFASGRAASESDRGIHAVREGRLLAVGAGIEDWGRLSIVPALAALSEFLGETLRRSMLTLPPIGVVRFDDFPGTAQHQLEGRDKGDRRQARRMRRILSAFAKRGGVLNVAVAAQALSGGDVTALENVFPKAVGELHAGAERGELEPVCHGLLHLDPHARARGELEFREFQRLDRAETASRLAAALYWQERTIERPSTFVAPAWAYGDFRCGRIG